MVATVLAGWVLLDRSRPVSRQPPSRRQYLVEAFGTARLAGVRLAGVEISAVEVELFLPAERRAVAREIEAEARRYPTARSQGDLALLRLVTGRYDAAIQILEKASRSEPSEASLGADLAAAFLVRGRALERPRDVVRALDRVGPRPRTPELQFDRALALQTLYLRRLAREAWSGYVERNPASPWGLLAAGYLRTLTAQEGSRPVSENPNSDGDLSTEPPDRSTRPEELQTWVERRGFLAWSNAVLGTDAVGRRAAEERLRRAGHRLAELSGDRLIADGAATLARVPEERAKASAQALAAYIDGRDLLARYSFEKALARFDAADAAAERLGSGGSPWALLVEIGIAHCEFQLQRYDGARRKAELVLAAAREKRYAAVEAHAVWVLAGIGLATLDLGAAERYAEEGQNIARRAKNRSGGAIASLQRSRVADELGRSTEAWLHRLQGFRELAEDGRTEQLALAIGNASFALAREGEFRAAADFASEVLAFDRSQGTPLGLAESLWMRAMHRAKAGDAQGALSDAREAESHIPRVESAANRARLLAGLRVIEGELLGESQPLVALSRLDEALGFLRQNGYEYGQAEALLDRAHVLRRLDRLEEALADLDRAAGIVGTQRERIHEPLQRVSFFDLQAGLADERVATSALVDPHGERAFWAADQARGLLFRESLGLLPDASEVPPASVGSIAIDPADAVLSYWSLPDSLLIWVVRRGQAPHLVRSSISRVELGNVISNLVFGIEDGTEPPVLRAAARRVGASLIDPIASELRGARRLIIVPDRFVRAVPWPVVEGGAGEGPLLRRFVIRICPAVEVLDRAGKREWGEGGGPLPEVALAVGDPRVEGAAGATYPNLPGARREVEALAGLFSGTVTLTGREATRDRVLGGLERASIVHIASHFLVGQTPDSSRIVLAGPQGDGSGSLDAATIASLSLPHLRLVVLSGCASDREGEPSLEGTFALAGSFLAAGSAESLATLWPVDDRVTSELMSRFYRELSRGARADEALRLAQLAFLDDPQSDFRAPASWAPFQLISLTSRGTERVPRKELR